MDLLESLNVTDLPEQQTRISHLMEANPDFEGSLGFDACGACGASLLPLPEVVHCRACQRVSYCSEACREMDSQFHLRKHHPTTDNGDDYDDDDQRTSPEDNAMGHTSVICALLNLCHHDEAIDDNNNTRLLDPAAQEAARMRVRSEYESYPATLANVLCDGPCYQATLQRVQQQQSTTCLVIHVVGASEQAELSRGPTNATDNNNNNSNHNNNTFTAVGHDYAEALAELAHQWHVATIELVMVGPECPRDPVNESIPMRYLDDQTVGHLQLRSIRGRYNAETLQNTEATRPADIVVLFNPGLTCPDYPHWTETLRCIPNGTPFLLTTNTEMEGLADCQFLLDQDKIQSLPPVLAELLGLATGHDGDDDDDDHRTEDSSSPPPHSSFFAVNPYCGSRVRQNGTMANDVFVKNRWILGGILDRFDPSPVRGGSNTTTTTTMTNKRMKTTTATDPIDINTKAKNPALI